MKFLLILFLLIFSFPLVLAQLSIGTDNTDLPRVAIEPPSPTVSSFANNTGSVNRSDFWDDLDTPADISISDLNNNLVSWVSTADPFIYNDTSGVQVGIGTASPHTQFEVNSDDGRILMGTGVFDNKAATTDTGIEFNHSGSSYKSGIYTEVDGAIIDLGINAPQIGDRDNTFTGGNFRFDTRAGQNKFTVIGYPTGTDTGETFLEVSLQTGQTTYSDVNRQRSIHANSVWGATMWNPSGGNEVNLAGSTYGLLVRDGNVGIGLTNPEHKLTVNGTTNISADLYVGDDLFVIDDVGIGTTSPPSTLSVVSTDTGVVAVGNHTFTPLTLIHANGTGINEGSIRVDNSAGGATLTAYRTDAGMAASLQAGNAGGVFAFSVEGTDGEFRIINQSLENVLDGSFSGSEASTAMYIDDRLRTHFGQGTKTNSQLDVLGFVADRTLLTLKGADSQSGEILELKTNGNKVIGVIESDGSYGIKMENVPSAFSLSVNGSVNVSNSLNVSSIGDVCIEGGNCLSTAGGGATSWLFGSNIIYNETANVSIGSSNPTIHRLLVVGNSPGDNNQLVNITNLATTDSRALYIESADSNDPIVEIVGNAGDSNWKFKGNGDLVLEKGGNVVTIANGGDGIFDISGATKSILKIQSVQVFEKIEANDFFEIISAGGYDIRTFADAGEGVTPYIRQHGFGTGGASTYLQMQVKEGASNTYLFNGTMSQLEINSLTNISGNDLWVGDDLFVIDDVGIGTTSPTHTVNIFGEVNNDYLVNITNSGSTQGKGVLVKSASAGGDPLVFAEGGGGAYTEMTAQGQLRFGDSGGRNIAFSASNGILTISPRDSGTDLQMRYNVGGGLVQVFSKAVANDYFQVLNSGPSVYYFDTSSAQGKTFDMRVYGTGDGGSLSYGSFSIHNDSNSYFLINSSTNNIIVDSNVNITGNLSVGNGTLFYDRDFRRLGINTASPTHPLNVIGDINATGDICINGTGTCLGLMNNTIIGETGRLYVNLTGDTMTGQLIVQSGNGKIVTTGSAGGIDVQTSSGQAGSISFGNTADIGISQDGVSATYDYDGAFIFKQKASNPDDIGEFIFIEEAGDWRFALPSSGADYGTYNPRSMIIAGPSVNNASNFLCSVWGFDNLDCDTSGTGADLGVQDDFEVLGIGYFGGGAVNISQLSGNITANSIVAGTRIGIGDTTPDVALDVVGDIIASSDITAQDDLFVTDFALLGAARIGTTNTDPGVGNLYVENDIDVDGAINGISFAMLAPDTTAGSFTQDSTTGADPVVSIKQDDISEGFIDFLGSARGGVTVTDDASDDWTSAESLRVELNGVKYVIALFPDQ